MAPRPLPVTRTSVTDVFQRTASRRLGIIDRTGAAFPGPDRSADLLITVASIKEFEQERDSDRPVRGQHTSQPRTVIRRGTRQAMVVADFNPGLSWATHEASPARGLAPHGHRAANGS
jgi:hypothetical protein